MSNHPESGQAKDFYLDSPDALSALLSGLELQAEVSVDGDFCGAWAVDTSGSRRIPFHLIGGGKAWLHHGDAPPRLLMPGDLVLFPQDDVHIISSSEAPPPQALINQLPALTLGEPVTNMVCGFFEFGNKASWPLLNTLAPIIHFDLNTSSSLPRVKSYIDLLLSELQQRQAGFFAVVNQLAFLLFVEVLRQQIHSGAVKEGLLAALFDSKVSKALEAIHNKPGNDWSLEKLAAEARMSRSAFAQKFTQLVGLPAMQYLSAWRMQQARWKLKNTDFSLAVIAEDCGYESEAAFRKAFKKITGVPPGQVRKEG